MLSDRLKSVLIRQNRLRDRKRDTTGYFNVTDAAIKNTLHLAVGVVQDIDMLSFLLSQSTGGYSKHAAGMVLTLITFLFSSLRDRGTI